MNAAALKYSFGHILTLFLLAFSCLSAEAANWGDFKRDDCRGYRTRQYSSRLWNIWGSWENACAAQSATINGQYFARPTRCVNVGAAGMWGEWDLVDDSCKANWGALAANNCVTNTHRQYSARLWNVPSGQSWEDACNSTPHNVGPGPYTYFARPTRCKNMGISGMWGEWDAPDNSCGPYWGDITQKECNNAGKRKWSAILWNIPPGQSWENTCNNQSATVSGTYFAKPTRCVNTSLNMWGEWDVDDAACKANWGDLAKNSCVTNTHRQYSARLWNIPSGQSWQDACNSAPNTVAGTYFAKPTRCKDLGASGMWGEWDAPDNSCAPYWGDITQKECTGSQRKWSAILWNIPPGQSWENTCNNQSATVNGTYFARPTRCVNTSLNMWGEWSVNDAKCENPYWAVNAGDAIDTIKDDGCKMEYGGYRRYSSRLWNIRNGDSWKQVCNEKAPLTIKGVRYDRPHQCVDLGAGGMWGEWYVQDNSCKRRELSDMNAHWGQVKKEGCGRMPNTNSLAPTYRKYSSILWDIPAGQSWEAACQHFPITIGDTTFGSAQNQAKRCVNTSLNMWGEFYVSDASCGNINTNPSRGTDSGVKSAPLSGYADLHSHPFVDQAFGGALFGSANGTVQEAFAGHASAGDVHQQYTWLSKVNTAMSLDDIMWIAMVPYGQRKLFDQGSGYPNFDSGSGTASQDAWPRIWDSSHQQMHAQWIKRAHKGGLRVLVGLAVNNGYTFHKDVDGTPSYDRDDTRIPDIGKLNAGDAKLTLDDWTSMLAQTKQAHRFAKENPWVTLAFTPEDADNAVKVGKMAFIWGSEVDQAYNCKNTAMQRDGKYRGQSRTAKDCTRRDIDKAIMVQDMLGIKYQFPIHLKDNGLGLAAVNSAAASNGYDATGKGDSERSGLERCKDNGFNGGPAGWSDSTNPNMNQCGRSGLRDMGRYAIQRSWGNGNLIDVGHISHKGMDEAITMANTYKVPVVNGHTGIFDLSVGERRHEGNATVAQLERVRQTGGMVGLMTWQGKLSENVGIANSPIPILCGGSSQLIVNVYQHLLNKGWGYNDSANLAGNITYATDFNGFAALPTGRTQEYFFRSANDRRTCWYGTEDKSYTPMVQYPFNLPPGLTPAHNSNDLPGTSLGQHQLTPGMASSKVDFNSRGLATVGQIPDLLEDMRVQGTSLATLEPLYRSAAGVVTMWKKLRANSEQALFWFDHSLTSQYSFADYPMRRIPQKFVRFNTALSEQSNSNNGGVCRVWNGTEYDMGIELNPKSAGRPLEEGRCVTANSVIPRGDYDSLAIKFDRMAWANPNSPPRDMVMVKLNPNSNANSNSLSKSLIVSERNSNLRIARGGERSQSGRKVICRLSQSYWGGAQDTQMGVLTDSGACQSFSVRIQGTAVTRTPVTIEANKTEVLFARMPVDAVIEGSPLSADNSLVESDGVYAP